MGAFCTNSVQRLPNFLFSCKSQAAFLVGHVLNSCQYTIILYFEVWIVQTPCTYLMYYMYVYVSVRYSLLDDAECRDPVYCIAHTMSTRSTSPVGMQYTGIYFQRYSQYILYSTPSGFHTTWYFRASHCARYCWSTVFYSESISLEYAAVFPGSIL